MDLTKIFVKEKDPREEKIKTLLKKALEEWPKKSLEGREYLKQAIKIRKNIERDKGRIYFEKYPEILLKIDKTIEKLMEYDS